MEKNEILDLAKTVGEAISSSSEMERLNKAKDAQDASEEAQKLIGEYNLVRLNVMQRVQNEEDQSEENMKKYQTEMAEAFDKLMQNDIIKEFVEANDAVDTLVNQVKNIIDYCVTGETECTSDCSTCGGACHR